MNDEQSQKLNELHRAVVGDEMGNPGLVKRVQNLEAWRQGLMLKIATVTGVCIAVGVMLKYVLTGKVG